MSVMLAQLNQGASGESAARILAAADRERRRLERDLHDGAQQRLVSLSMRLRLLRTRLAPGSEAERLLAIAQDELAASLQELRELARGCRPSSASTASAARSSRWRCARRCPVELDVLLEDRPPAAVEVAAYYLVLRGAHQHREVRKRRHRDRPGRPGRGRPARRRDRRQRRRRRRPRRWLGPARARRSNRGAVRPASRVERSGDGHHGAGRDPTAGPGA